MGFMLINSNLHAQNTWYVNNNSLAGDVYTTAVGNDSTNLVNDPSRPSLTIGDALTAAAAGDIIYIDTGSYVGGDNQSLALNKAITIIGAGTGNTIIQGFGDNRFGIVSVNNVIIRNLQFFQFIYASGPGQVFLVNTNITGFRLINIVMSRNNGSSNGGDSITLLSGSSSTFDGLFFSCSGFNGGSGGGIKVNSATLVIRNSVFSQSRDADGRGGAIEILGASNVTINNCNFDGNSARAGGAIAQTGGTLAVTNSCFNRNYAQGDSGNSSNGGGHYFATGTILSASFTNCRFEGAFFCATNNPAGYLCEANSNIANDGNAVNLKNVAGTFTFDTCIFNNSNQPNANFDDGLDIHLDKASSGTISVTVNNCSFANDMFGGVGSGGSDAVNIWNQNLTSTEFIVTNSGTRQTTANQDGIAGNNFSYSGTVPGGNTAEQTSAPTVICLGQITGCSISVNCLTEIKAPVITTCVDNKIITNCSGNLPNYTSEVSAYDDCFYTITQSPAPGTTLASLGGNGVHTITMTVSDQSPNSPDTTCTFTITLSGCAITCSDTTTWNGTWSNGAPTDTKSAIFTTNYTAVADVFACSVTISDNAVVTIPSGFDCTVSRDITVNTGSSFVFENTANLLQLNTTATNTGNIRMTRNTNPLIRLDYTLWSAPVTGQNLLAFSPLTLANRFYTYNTNTNFYNTVTPSTTPFTPGKGFQIRTPNNHPTTATVWSGTFEGVPNNGGYTTTLANFGIGQRFNMVGNPYPSPIDIAAFVAANENNITGTLWFWRKTNSIITSNIWSTWNGETFIGTLEDFGNINPNNLARNGQGFFVEAKDASTALVFNNSMRRANNTNQFFRSELTNSTENTNTVVPNAKHRIWLNLTDNTGLWYQQAISYIAGGTAQVDQFDGKSISTGNMLFNSIIPNSTDYYVIQSRSVPFDTEDSIALNIKITNPGTYSISVSNKDGLFADGTQPIFLTDNFSTTCVNLNEGAYSFTAEAGTFDNRFELRYTNNLLGTPDNTLTPNSVMVYQNNTNKLIVSSSKNPLEKIAIYDTTGRLLFSQDSINNNAFSTTLDFFANVLLLVQITDSNGLVITKKIIKQ